MPESPPAPTGDGPKESPFLRRLKKNLEGQPTAGLPTETEAKAGELPEEPELPAPKEEKLLGAEKEKAPPAPPEPPRKPEKTVADKTGTGKPTLSEPFETLLQDLAASKSAPKSPAESGGEPTPATPSIIRRERQRPAITVNLAEGSEEQERQRLDSELSDLFIYKLLTGNDKAEEVPEGFVFSSEMREVAKKFLEKRQALLDSFVKEYKFRSALKKSGGEKGGAELGETVTWRENAELAYEKALEELKKSLLDNFLQRKKEQYPELTPKDLEKEALAYSARFILEAAKNIDTDLERLKGELAYEAKEKGLARMLWEKYTHLSRGKRLVIGAIISAGVGAGTALLFGPGGLLGVTLVSKVSFGHRLARAAGGAKLGATIQSAVDKFWLRKKFAKERMEIMEEEQTAVLRQLREEVGSESGWLEDEEKKIKLMSIVDAEAREYRKKLGDQANKEGRARMYAALATGVIGGLTVAGFDTWLTLRGARNAAVQAALENHQTAAKTVAKASLPIESEIKSGAAAVTIPPEKIAEVASKGSLETAAKPVTVEHGDSLWKITRRLVKSGAITEEQWRDGWQHSPVEILSHGKPKSAPISEIGLIHPGDQVTVAQEGGKTVFRVADYAKDNLHLGDNQTYYDILKQAGKQPPEWLERAVEMKQGAKSAVENANTLLNVERFKLEIPPVVANPFESAPPARLYTDPADLLAVFKDSGLDRQETMIRQLGAQKTKVMDLMSQTAKASSLETYKSWVGEISNLENAFANAPDYIQNLETFNSLLETGGSLHPLYNVVKTIRVRELLAVARGSVDVGELGYGDTIAGMWQERRGDWIKLANLIEGYMPGRVERGFTVDRFLKMVVE